MASSTYACQAIILKKTKFSENDLIITFLDGDNFLKKAIAKGARKPNGRFSAHLELFNLVDLLVVKGKNLDIITESRLLEERSLSHVDPMYGAASSVISELASKIMEPGLAIDKLFAMTLKGLQSIEAASEDGTASIVAAYILKAIAFSGVVPSLLHCAFCGSGIGEGASDRRSGKVNFSFVEGGIICNDCKDACEVSVISRRLTDYASFLLHARFGDIAGKGADFDLIYDLLLFCKQWLLIHFGIKLKSLDMFLVLVS